jgi:putative endopeptidase
MPAITIAQTTPPAPTETVLTGLDLAGMDRAVRPGEDFYAYANGTWQRGAVIPSDRSWIGVPIAMQEKSAAQIRSLIQDASTRPGSKMGDLYASYADETTVAAQGLTPVRPWLDTIDGASDRTQLAAVMGSLARYDIGSLFGFGIGEDDRTPGSAVVTLKQGGLVLQNRDLYLVGDRPDPRMSAYRIYLTRMLTLAGADRPAERAEAIIAFETALAKVHWTASASRDADRVYNPRSPDELAREAPGFDWTAWLGAMELGDRPRYIVAQPDALAGEAAIWACTPLPVLQDSLRIRLLTSYARYLPAAFSDARFAMFGTAMTGATGEPPRWRRGVALVTNLLADDVGRQYAATYLPPEAHDAAARLVRNIVEALDAKLASADWLTPATRARARAKLARTRLKIGYPDRWPDDMRVQIDRGDLIGNVARANAALFARMRAKLDRPLDPDAWIAPVTVPNAFASAGANEIVLPAAVLQPPLFSPKADAAENYARIGATVAHELCHLFDDQGRKYDENGALKDWWTPADVAAYKARERALIAQFAEYTPLPGTHINGELTIGENIADLAGLEVAFAAFRRLPASARPIRNGLSADQRFFIAWAQAWRTAYREPFLRTMLQSDAHAPGRERALTVKNMDAWHSAFHLTKTDEAALPPNARVRFW